MGYSILPFIIMGIGMLVQMRLKNKFIKYSKVPTSSGLSGAEIAAKMLRDNNIHDVKIESTPGFLSDHYNPANKTVNLSAEVYNGRNVSAAAVAAHECGHAVQHARAYSMLTLRSQLVPVVQFSSNIVQYVLLAGIFLINVFPFLLLGGVILFAITALFSVITLPVEFDASKRALAWLDNTNIMQREEHNDAKDALKWAALTYVVAAIGSVATLLQYLSIYLNRNRN